MLKYVEYQKAQKWAFGMKGTLAVSAYVSIETCHTLMVGDVQLLDTFLDACQNCGVVHYLNI